MFTRMMFTIACMQSLSDDADNRGGYADPMSSLVPGVDMMDLCLSFPIPDGDVDHPDGDHYPMSSGSLGVDTIALSLEPPVSGGDVHHNVMYAIHCSIMLTIVVNMQSRIRCRLGFLMLI